MFLVVSVGIDSVARTTCASKDEAILMMHKYFEKFLTDYDYNGVKPDIMISKDTEIEFAYGEDYQSYFVVEKPKTEKEEIELLLKEQEKAIDLSGYTTDMIEECKYYITEIKRHLEKI